MTAIPDEIRNLLDGPNYIHLTTLRGDGSPRNHVVWAWLEDDNVVIAAAEESAKARDMKRDPRVALSVVDSENPYRMAALRGHVIEFRPDDQLQLMDRIAIKYTSAPFPSREARRVYFVIAIASAYQRTFDAFVHNPAERASVGT